ncbi:MAG TPA: VCBS repeat-containing protein [Pyrinomonadaceae bacterium]|jgi:hypothetical protein
MRRTIFLSVTALLIASVFTNFTLFVSANTTPQTLPFSQPWTNTALITTNDDWTNVPGIVGYLGDIGTTTQANLDPRAITQDFATQDVIANQTNPDTQTSGGVAEFEITNPTIALQGSGTADAPNIVIYLNTTGQSNIRVTFNARDIDASADDTNQQLAVQYRVGTTGNFSNVPGPGAYFADVTTGATATQVTPVAVTLPPTANNQPNVQVRILTTNAPGSDEWVGIDDIVISGGGAQNPFRTESDFNGDGRTDYAVTRNLATLMQWIISPSTGTSGSPDSASVTQFGNSTDRQVPADYDGDGRTDIAVYRPAAAPNSFFYVLQSSNGTLLFRELGATGDDPTIVGDYDGDGKADMAVYRASAGQGFFYYRPSTAPTGIVFVPFGSGTTTRAVPGDYDGDGKFDFCVRRDAGGGQAQFVVAKSAGGTDYVNWGIMSDLVAPGDYDGDLKWDYTAVRPTGGNHFWYVLGSTTGAFNVAWGLTSDTLVPGDYDGDGRTDIAVWRGAVDPTQNFYYIRQSSANFGLGAVEFGQTGDYPVQNFRVR